MVPQSRTWTWNNPHNGQPSHSMRMRFDISAATDGNIIEVEISNVQMDGWNESSPDPGTTQDNIVLARPGSPLPATAPAPPRPIPLPFPSNLAATGGLAEMSTYLNSGSPQRYYWNQGSSHSYTIPYDGPNTVVAASWWSAFAGENIEWTPTDFVVRLSDLDYRPGQHRVNGTWQSHNRGAGKADKRQSGSYVTMRTQSGPDGTGNPPLIRRGGVWRNQSKIGANS